MVFGAGLCSGQESNLMSRTEFRWPFLRLPGLHDPERDSYVLGEGAGEDEVKAEGDGHGADAN